MGQIAVDWATNNKKRRAIGAGALVFVLATAVSWVVLRYYQTREKDIKATVRLYTFSRSQDEEQWWVEEVVKGKPYLKENVYYLPLWGVDLVLGGKESVLGVAWISELEKCDLGRGAFWRNEKVVEVAEKIEPGTKVKFLLTVGIEPGYLEKVQKDARCHSSCQERIKLLQERLPFNRAYVEAVKRGRKYSQIIGPPGQIMFCLVD